MVIPYISALGDGLNPETTLSMLLGVFDHNTIDYFHAPVLHGDEKKMAIWFL